MTANIGIDRSTYPAYHEDLFSRDALWNPFPHYKAIRDAGPVVRIAKMDILAISRFKGCPGGASQP